MITKGRSYALTYDPPDYDLQSTTYSCQEKAVDGMLDAEDRGLSFLTAQSILDGNLGER